MKKYFDVNGKQLRVGQKVVFILGWSVLKTGTIQAIFQQDSPESVIQIDYIDGKYDTQYCTYKRPKETLIIKNPIK